MKCACCGCDININIDLYYHDDVNSRDFCKNCIIGREFFTNRGGRQYHRGKAFYTYIKCSICGELVRDDWMSIGGRNPTQPDFDDPDPVYFDKPGFANRGKLAEYRHRNCRPVIFDD